MTNAYILLHAPRKSYRICLCMYACGGRHFQRVYKRPMLRRAVMSQRLDEDSPVKILSLQSDADVYLRTVVLTERPHERMRGLLGRKGLPVGHAMWFNPCVAVHTFFMQFSIDLVFLSRELVVTDVRVGVKPWRAVFGSKGAYSVLEVQTGWLEHDRLTIGTQFSHSTLFAHR